MSKAVLTGVAALALAFCAGCAHSPPYEPLDPLEPVNRAMYSFNDTLDYYVVEPAARGYTTVTPDLVEQGIGNFLANLKYPIVIANSLFQAKFVQFASDLGRFVVNSTVGILGLFDVASGWGLEEHNEDFGQTLGYWGLGQGIYLMLPVLGPSTGRDLTGDVVDWFLDPTNYIEDTATQYALQVLYLLDLRASLLGFEDVVRNAFDPYVFVRTAYLADRLAKVYDGNPPRAPLEFEPSPENEAQRPGGPAFTPESEAAPAGKPEPAPASEPQPE